MTWLQAAPLLDRNSELLMFSSTAVAVSLLEEFTLLPLSYTELSLYVREVSFRLFSSYAVCLQILLSQMDDEVKRICKGAAVA
jgi:hypothetical protein